MSFFLPIVRKFFDFWIFADPMIFDLLFFSLLIVFNCFPQNSCHSNPNSPFLPRKNKVYLLFNIIETLQKQSHANEFREKHNIWWLNDMKNHERHTNSSGNNIWDWNFKFKVKNLVVKYTKIKEFQKFMCVCVSQAQTS